MLRPLSTYLLLVITCLFSLIGLTGICLSDSLRLTSTQAEAVYHIVPFKQAVFSQDKTNDIPVHKFFLCENFEAENETEVETDLKTDICTLSLPEYSSNDFQCFLQDAFTSYSFISIKIDFLDIFSPPPNC